MITDRVLDRLLRLLDVRPACGHVQPVPLGRWAPHVCSRWRWHRGDHRAVIAGRRVARWSR